MTDTRQALPPLPEPAAEARWWEQNGFDAHELSLLRSHPDAEKYWGTRDKLSLFTAEQMQAYARAALAAQPVALPAGSSGLTDEKCDDLLRKSGLWPLACVSPQNRALLRGLCHESAVAAQPVAGAAPAPEPSAQGEPPRFFDLLFELAQTGHISDRGITGEAMQQIRTALASAPSTPPPAVVEAVPLTDEQACEFAALCVMNRRSSKTAREMLAEYREELARGIAPKAAQPVEGER